MVRGLAVLAGSGVTAGQEQDRALDNPISTPQPAARSPRAGTPGPAGQPRQGAMGERRVSEPRPEARLRGVRVSEQAGGVAGAVGAHQGIHSSKAVAGAPIASTAATRMRPGLHGGTARPPQPAEQALDFDSVYRRLRYVMNQYRKQPEREIFRDLKRAVDSLSIFVLRVFKDSGGDAATLPRIVGELTKTHLAYKELQEMARRAENDGNRVRASLIRQKLNDIDRRAAEKMQTLHRKFGLAALSPTQTPQPTPAVAVPPWDWCMTHRRLFEIKRYFLESGRFDDCKYVAACVRRIEGQVANRFGKLGNVTERLQPQRAPGHPSRPEQMYRILEKKARRTPAASPDTAAVRLRWDLEAINKKANKELRLLASKYGPLEVLAARAGLTGQQAPMTVGPTATMATEQVTAAPPLQPVDPVRAPGSVSVPPPSAPPRPETAAVELSSVTDLYSEPPGPSSRFMPSRAPRTPTAPAREVPPAQRKAIVERFRSGEALLHAGFTLGNGAADAFGWAAARESAVLDDLHRLHTSAAEDPRAAAALADIDWSGIEALTGMLDLPPLSP